MKQRSNYAVTWLAHVKKVADIESSALRRELSELV